MARDRHLRAVVAALLLFAGPALAQSSWPAQVVDSAPSGTCSATTYKGTVVERNTGDLWRCLDLDGDSTATWTKTRVVRYQDLDTSGNGTVDYRMVGDYDGDGTLELTDVQSALCDLQGLTVGSVGGGQTGCTGTTTVTDKTLFVLPGTYTGHYRTEFTIKAAGLTFMGAGMSATKLKQQDQACSSGSITGPDDSEAIDDGDGTQEQRVLFQIDADRVTLSDFSFDGGAGALYDYLAPKMRNRWDCDGDGTDDVNESMTEPPYSCSNYCTRDSASAIDIGDVENTVIARVNLSNANRMFIQAEVNPGTRTKDRALLIDHIITDRSGEHSFALSTDQVIFSNNISTRCGPYGSCCYLAPAYKRQQEINNNAFKYFVGSAICRESTGWFSSASAENFVISGNSISNIDSTIDGTARSVLSWGAIAMLAGGTPGSNDRMTISNNEIEIKGDICQYGVTVQGVDSSAYATGVAISGNTLKMTEQTRSITANTGIFSYYTKDATISGNTVQLAGDGVSGVESAISVTGSLNTVITGNVARVSGNGSRPISVGTATNTMILGNAVDLDPEGTPNETKGIVVGSSTGGVIAGNTIKDPEYGIWLSASSRFLVNGNACYDFSNCIVTDSGAGQNRITGNYAFYSGSNGYNYSWAWREDQASSTNLWADNQAIRSYLDNGGSQRYPYHGWVWETDENADATLDSTSRIKLFPKTKLAFEGATEDSYQTQFDFVDPTADRTATFPDATGTVCLDTGSSCLGAPSGATDLDGNGTAASADWDGNGTADELGHSLSEALYAKRLLAAPTSGAVDFDGDGTKWSPIRTHVSALVQARAHAALYGDPEYYLKGGVFDAYAEIFRGHPLHADYDRDGTKGDDGVGTGGEGTTATIPQCYSGSCSAVNQYICVNSLDPDSDGTNEFSVGDVVVVGTTSNTDTPKIRTHLITASAVDSANCGTGNTALTVIPGVDQTAEGVGTNVKLGNIWFNSYHPITGGYYLIGYRLGYASRLMHGAQGPNLLRNGNADYDAGSSERVENWTQTDGDGSMWGGSFAATPTQANQCFEGDTGGNECFYSVGGGGTFTESKDTISVSPGERYVLSGWYQSHYTDYVGLASDANADGTWNFESGMSHQFDSGIFWYNQLGAPWPFWFSFEIPQGVHKVKVRAQRNDTQATWFDDWTLRKVRSSWTVDSIKDSSNFGYATKSFLINDPGDRLIVVTGDSWTTGTAAINTGLADALQARFGRSFASQVINTGNGGDTAANLLSRFYVAIEKYEPLYAVIVIGTNDAYGSVATSDFVRNIREIQRRCMMIGTIPIFVSVNPIGVGPWGAGTAFTRSHDLRDAQRRALLGED